MSLLHKKVLEGKINISYENKNRQLHLKILKREKTILGFMKIIMNSYDDLQSFFFFNVIFSISQEKTQKI